MDNQKWTIQRNWQQDTKQNHNTICVGHHYTQANTNNVNKTGDLLQPTGGKDEPKFVFYAENSLVILLIYQTF